MARSDEPPPRPSVPKGWVPASRPYEAGFRGSASYFNRNLDELREGLIRDITAAGFPEEEAKALVDHNLIGRKKPSTGREGVYASPDAISLLHQKEREETAPIAAENWASANQLRRTHFLGDTSHLNRKFENLREGLIRDITAAGFPEEEAKALVDHNLIGRKRPVAGREALHASPDAIEMMERERLIRRKVADAGCEGSKQGFSRP